MKLADSGFGCAAPELTGRGSGSGYVTIETAGWEPMHEIDDLEAVALWQSLGLGTPV